MKIRRFEPKKSIHIHQILKNNKRKDGEEARKKTRRLINYGLPHIKI